MMVWQRRSPGLYQRDAEDVFFLPVNADVLARVRIPSTAVQVERTVILEEGKCVPK